MTTAVRLATWSGLLPLPNPDMSRQLATNGEHVLRQPRVSTDLLSCDTSTSDTSDASMSTSNACSVLSYEVQSGKVVHYEIAVSSGSTPSAPTTASPTLVGRGYLQWGPGWSITCKECSNP